MALEKWAESLALKLQESVTALSQTDIRRRLEDALRDCYEGTGHYCYVCDVYGDDQSGDVVYCCDGETCRAPYTMSSVEGRAASCEIDTEAAEDVVPRTIYEPEADEGDHMAAMESIAAGEYSEGAVPLCERFVSKAERDSASAESFAGKGKSFPILKPSDVMAAVRSIGRAGANNHSVDTIKANIKRIAKAKGWGKYLPKAWQESIQEAGARHSASDQSQIQAAHDAIVRAGANCGQQESTTGLSLATGEVPLRESSAFCAPVEIREGAATTYPIRIINPGWGSSGYYSRQVLERDGPKIFKAGTQMFFDHATDAEEAARPEGRMDDLAAVTTSDARWEDNGKEGPGLYAEAKVFADYADKVAEKAKYTGLSIRAGGVGKEGEAEGRKGIIVESLTRAQSIDFVTKAGRGGKVLVESARSTEEQQPTQEAADEMDAAELQKLNERLASQDAEIRKLRERSAIADAPGVIAGYFGTVAVAEGIRERVTKRILSGAIPLTESGDLDGAKIKALVEAETKEECEYVSRLSGGRIVTGMSSATGTQQAAQLTEAQKAEIDAQRQDERRQSASLRGFNIDVHKHGVSILERGRVAFDPAYNSREARGAKMTADSALTLEVNA